MAGDDRRTVLVVDDDRDLRFLVTFVLEAEGYRVEAAGDGREALGMVERCMPDLILLDMKMPGMDGWQFAQQFHATYDSRAPILLLTAAEDARRLAAETGARGCIGKPFEVDALVRAVALHLRTRS